MQHRTFYPLFFFTDRGLVVIEPWRCFEVINSGIKRDDGNFSIVPLKLIDEGLIYEKEIPPGVCRHIVKTLKENTVNKVDAKKMLNILCELPFNNKCKITSTKTVYRK